jgi:hypothetical protein
MALAECISDHRRYHRSDSLKPLPNRVEEGLQAISSPEAKASAQRPRERESLPNEGMEDGYPIPPAVPLTRSCPSRVEDGNLSDLPGRLGYKSIALPTFEQFAVRSAKNLAPAPRCGNAPPSATPLESLASRPCTARLQPFSFRVRVGTLMLGLKRCSSRQLSAKRFGFGYRSGLGSACC